MAQSTARYDSGTFHQSRDPSNANITVSYAGGVAAQSAVDPADLAHFHAPFLDMQPEDTSKGLPCHNSSSTDHLHFSAFSGSSSLPSFQFQLPADSIPGSRSYTNDLKQGLGLTVEARLSSEPWTTYQAAGGSQEASSVTISPVTSSLRNIDTCSNVPSFQDSGYGTISGSQHETQSVISTPVRPMSFSGPGYVPVQPEETYPDTSLQDADYEDDDEEVVTDQLPPNLACTECKHVAKTPSEFKKHNARHQRSHVCHEPNCGRSGKGFATINDLHRHQKSVHQHDSRKTRSYKCFADTCSKADKIWPRLDNFKQHLHRMHSDQNMDALVDRSNKWYDSEPRETSVSTSHGLQASLRVPPTSTDLQRKRHASLSGPIPGQPNVQTQIPCNYDPNRLSPYSALNQGAWRQRGPSKTISTAGPQVRWTPYANPYNMARSKSDRNQNVPKRSSAAQSQEEIPQYGIPQWGCLSQMSSSDDSNPVLNMDLYQQQSLYPENINKAWTLPDDGRDFQIQRLTMMNQPQIPANSGDLPDQSETLMFAFNQPMDYSMYNMTDGSDTPHTPTPAKGSDIVVHNQGESPGDTSQEAIDDIKSFLQEYEAKNDHERSAFITARIKNLQKALTSLGSARTVPSLSEAGMTSSGSNAKAITCPANNKTYYTCPQCDKVKTRLCELKKHIKRHTRPYGCAFDYCYKKFGSKNDWKRHEGAQHEQQQCFRCDGSHKSKGKPCYRVFYKEANHYRHHLETCGMNDVQVEQMVSARRIPGNNQQSFWCGFCNTVIRHGKIGAEAVSARLDHIDAQHFSKGEKISDWIELGGEGKTKGEMERLKMQGSTNETEPSSSSSNTSSTCSTSSSSENQDGSSSQSPSMNAPSSRKRQASTASLLQRAQIPAQELLHIQQSRQPTTAAPSRSPVRQQHQQQRRGGHLHSFRDPTPENTGPRRATHARCCECQLEWPFALGSECTSCFHALCDNCETRI